MNKFAKWIDANDKKQRGVAEKLGISTSTLNDILRKGQMPKLELAYQIEAYTKGAITVYDWIDQLHQKQRAVAKATIKTKSKKIKAHTNSG